MSYPVPQGPAGGGLGGTYPNPTVKGVPPGTITLEQYGAVGNGTTSDYAAWVAAFAYMAAQSASGVGVTLLLGCNKRYLISGAAQTLPAGCSIVGYGRSSELLIASNNPAIIIGGDQTTCENFQIVGTFGSGATAAQVGIQNGQYGVGNSGFCYVKIGGVTLTSLPTGIDCNQYNSTHHGPMIRDCVAALCGGYTLGMGGFNLGTLAEYTSLNGLHAENCEVGINWGAGNLNAVGCVISDSSHYGVWVRGDNLVTFVNDAHGVLSGCTINHADSGYALRVDATVHSMLLSGCVMYGGGILLTSSTSVVFASCILDMASYGFDGAQGTVFHGCTFPQGGTNTVTNNLNSHPSTTRWTEDNWGPDGTFPAFILAADDQTGWTVPVMGTLQLPRQGNASPLVTDPVGYVGGMIANPLALPGSMLWLRADLGVTIATGVSAWADQSGVGDANRTFSQATGASQPTLNASNSSFNGKPTVHFAASAVRLASGVWSVAPPQATGTLFLVLQTGNAASNWIVGCLPADTQYALYQGAPGVLDIDFSNNVQLAATSLLSGPVMILVDLNGSTSQGYVASLTPTAQALKYNETFAPGSASCTGWTLGNTSGGGNPMNGDIAEVWVSSSRLNAAQRQALFSYASERYG